MLWVGFLINQIRFHDGRLSWVFYVAMTIFTIFILIADFVMNKYFVSCFGGTKIGEYIALIGVIVGVLCLSVIWYHYRSICCCSIYC